MIEIRTDDVIAALTAQRNAAFDELAQQAAIIRSLQRRVAALEAPPIEQEPAPI